MQWLKELLPEFGRPWAFAVLLPLVGMAVWQMLKGRRKKVEEEVPFFDPSLLESVELPKPPKRRFIPPILLALGLVLLSVVVAKPLQTELVPGENRSAVMIVLDVSSSMLCEDVEPENRFTAAKSVIRQVIETAPAGLNIGLVTFGANATLRHRPIQDRTALLSTLDAVETEKGGTRTGEGVFAALNAATGFATNGEPVQLFLISDGEENAEGSNMKLPRATEEVVAAGYTMNAAAYGTKDNLCGGSYQEPAFGAMSTAAAATGGEYIEAATAEELAKLFESIPEAVSFTETKVMHDRAVTVLVASAFGLVLVSVGLARRWGIWFQG